ncbi:MAG: glycosyltransferase family 4 protein [Labilibaculum sp.]|nr:glycosyltransferase family 4 protein [Labilibaculum sp.]
MVIAFYTDQMYLHGGIEKILSQKLNYLADKTNYSIHLITSEQKGNNFCYEVSTKVNHKDLEVNYKRDTSYFSFTNLKKVPKHIIRLKQHLNKIKPDVLVVCNYAFDFYFIPFITKNIKTIKEFHSSRYFYEKEYNLSSKSQKMILNLNKWVEKRYTNLVVLNKDERKHYPSENVVIIPNFSASNTSLEGCLKKNIIIAAGRVAPIKQFDHLIQSWSIIGDKYPDWEVHIYGEGDFILTEKLKKLIKDLEVPNIYLKGATNYLDKKMQEASIFAMTSTTECFPMVLLESLNNGLPIVSYNCPYGPCNIITNNEDGVLVAHNNRDEFALKLSNLIDDKSLRNRMGKNGSKNVKRFNEEIIMQQWLDLLEKKLLNDF